MMFPYSPAKPLLGSHLCKKSILKITIVSIVVKVTFPEELKRGGPFSIPWWILGVFAASRLKICGSIKGNTLN